MNIINRRLYFFKEFKIDILGDLVKHSFSTSCSLYRKSVIPKGYVRKWEANSNKPTLFPTATSVGDYQIDYEATTQTLPVDSAKNAMPIEEILVKHSDKVKDLSVMLKISLDDAAFLFQKYKFLMNSKMATLESKINYLLEKGISKDGLLSDMWILTYTIPTIEKRMELLNKLNMKPIKPWLLRCSDQALLRMSFNRENNRLAMGSHDTVAHYLKERLDITDLQIMIFSSRCPPVMRVKVAKLKEIIDFLYSEGFTSQQIYKTPRILCHSLDTIQTRLKELRDNKYEPQALSLLCKSKRHFKKILLSIRKD